MRVKIREDLLPPSKEHYEKRFRSGVEECHAFNEHIKSVAKVTGIDETIVRDTVVLYLKTVCDIMMYVSLKKNTTINIVSFFKIVIIAHTSNFKLRKSKNLRS